MELFNKLKNLIWSEDEYDEAYDEYEADAPKAQVSPFEPCAGKLMVVKPDVYVNVGLLSSYLCAGYVVLMDLSGVSTEGARRILDFLSGAAYSRDGSLTQISSKGYLLAPCGVDVSDWNAVKDDEWEYDSAFNF